MLAKVGLAGFEGRKPRQLSGGQQQRVALARALIFDPDALLLDEPLGALDKRLRESMQFEIKALQRRTGISVLYVTHDQEEAMVMSDRIAILRDGRLLQIGTPAEVYTRPGTVFVAAALGDTNLLPCLPTAEGNRAHARVVFADGSRGWARRPGGPAPECPGGTGAARMMIAVRPERVRILGAGEALENCVEGVVRDQTFAGSYIRCTVQALGQDVLVRSQDPRCTAAAQPGARVRIGWRGDDAQIIDRE